MRLSINFKRTLQAIFQQSSKKCSYSAEKITDNLLIICQQRMSNLPANILPFNLPTAFELTTKTHMEKPENPMFSMPQLYRYS